ncbi:glycosyltransferase family 4 protein [Peribacillus psychrosaccharolyticus]|uniref:glycosyltransferase family 4 protein n=1 Tax=Peribacillus psychrosaccharolyticus TaxID=1407 RepID=UPI0005901B6A|nr:glycosyltransferase family 4 protein [Peribacillus psychrosaccharolyticus]
MLHYGISPDKIYKFPYGIDSNYYDNTKLIKTRDSRKKLNIIFVGRVTQKKGAFYLFEAIRMMDLKLFTFKFAGSYDENSKYYKDFRDICTFVGHVTKEEIINLYRESDILVFPSLADGFGLSVLEALSFGIPVICSDNAGASDLIINGYNGYVVSTGVESEIYDKLIWFNNNRDKLQEMSINARKSAAELTWEKYNQNVKNAIKKIME